MRKEKEVEIGGHKFKVRSMSATMGRKMLLEYPKANAPKIGNYAESEKLALEMLEDCVQIDLGNGVVLPLDKTLIDQHLDMDTFVKLEKEVFAISSDFFTQENISNLIGAVGEILINQFSQILMAVLQDSSPKE